MSQILFRDFSIHVRCVGRCSCQGQVHLHRAALSIGITGWSVENLIDVLFHPQWRDSQALFENGTWNSHRTKWNLSHLTKIIVFSILFDFFYINFTIFIKMCETLVRCFNSTIWSAWLIHYDVLLQGTNCMARRRNFYL